MVPICIEFQAVDSLRIGYTWIVLGLELITEIHMLIILLGKNSTREPFERTPMVSLGAEFQVISVQGSTFMGIAYYSSSG